jgi:hypothetical protein
MSAKTQITPPSKLTQFEPILTQKNIAKPSEIMKTGLSPKKKENHIEISEKFTRKFPETSMKPYIEEKSPEKKLYEKPI